MPTGSRSLLTACVSCDSCGSGPVERPTVWSRACERKNCLASTDDVGVPRRGSGESGRSNPLWRAKLQIDAQGYCAVRRASGLEIPGGAESWWFRTARPTLPEYFGGLDALFAGCSLCLLKWLCLNGKNREVRSTLPREPSPPLEQMAQLLLKEPRTASTSRTASADVALIHNRAAQGPILSISPSRDVAALHSVPALTH